MLISDNAGAHEDDRLEEGNEIIHKPRSYFKNATDKALAGEVISCSGSFKICDEVVVTAGQLANLKRYTTKEKINRLVGREWSQMPFSLLHKEQIYGLPGGHTVIVSLATYWYDG